MRTQLLCTFTRKSKLNEIVDIIVSCNDILYDKIYVFENKDDSNQLICTYNVEFIENYEENIIDTISLHRKKQSNTLYTINALNECIKNLNNGVMDNKFMIPWENFKNMLMVTNSEGLNKINTRIYKIEKV